jgi:membrane-associated phospholipid phosphatase
MNLILALQTVAWLAAPMKFFTFLGSEEFFLLVMPVLYWCVDAGLGLRLAVILITSDGFNHLLKLAFHLPRPYWVDTHVRALAAEASYGLPSGHAQNAVAVWGFVAAQMKRRWAWIAALALIGLISLSRVYLGVHFPGDVVGGWLVGGALLWAFVRWESSVKAWLSGLNVVTQLGLALAISLIYLALAGGILRAIVSTPDPINWEQNARAPAPPADDEPAIDPRNPESPVSTAGLMFGLGAALALRKRARFDARGPWGKRAARFVVGLIGVLIFWLGLRVVFPEGTDLVALALRYVRYALTVFWALYLAPWAFLKTRLVEPAKELTVAADNHKGTGEPI